jgi:uncharacterized repeat protein (TIGR03803 family)
MTKNGGKNGFGVIFEWDISTGNYTHKVDFTSAIRYPGGKLVRYGSSYYGVSESGGIGKGAIFQWNPATNILTQMVSFDGNNGEAPRGDMILFADKFYGMTLEGGSAGLGVIFEWNPATNTLTKKIDFNGINGRYSYGGLTLLGSKLYGMTFRGGVNNAGVIFEWDPVSNAYIKKIDFGGVNGANPYGNLTFYNNKFYGLTYAGGTNSDGGVIFEWDPVSNVYARKYSFTMYGEDGSSPYGSLTLNSGKLYGVTYRGGSSASGVLFEWNPATNAYTKKSNLSRPGPAFPFYTQLLPIPAPVSSGNAGSCLTLPSITIDQSNSNSWVPITDSKGDVVAEIKANGSILGTLAGAIFINNGTTREDRSKKLFLDRNFTLTPQFQPTSIVDIRLYIKSAEFLALKNATSSSGQSSAVNNVNDVCIFQNAVNTCSPVILETAQPVVTGISNWENDYILSASITSFSSFYVASKSFAALPLNLLEFKGVLKNNDAFLTWTTEHEINTSRFDIERSVDGLNYTKIGSTEAANSPGSHQYTFTDPAFAFLTSPVTYYRLKQVDIGDEFIYSKVVSVSLDRNNSISLYPNPITDKAMLYVGSDRPDRLEISILDNLGRVVRQQQASIAATNNAITVDTGNLPGGMYYLLIKGQNFNKKLSFFKP